MIKFILGYVWTQIQTTKHKFWVSYYIMKYIIKTGHIYNYREKLSFLKRAIFHDLSKYRWSEASYFAKTIFDLKHSTYGSEEYKKLLEEIKPAIDNHYKRNRHHPEYHKNGFIDMTELDKLEFYRIEELLKNHEEFVNEENKRYDKQHKDQEKQFEQAKHQQSNYGGFKFPKVEIPKINIPKMSKQRRRNR